MCHQEIFRVKKLLKLFHNHPKGCFMSMEEEKIATNLFIYSVELNAEAASSRFTKSFVQVVM